MPDLKKQMTQAQIAEQIANLFGSYIDKPNDPQAKGTLQDPNFYKQFNALAGPSGYTAGDIGFLQQNPQYRGIRMVLPQSGGSYGQAQQAEGYYGNQQGLRRQMTQGPVGLPDPNDPHQNGIPLVPPNSPPDRGGLQQMILGHLISRGYPVLGGSGDLFGFQPGFNPIGFGQR